MLLVSRGEPEHGGQYAGGSGAAEAIECGQQVHVHLDVTAQPAGAGQGALVGDQNRQRVGITTCSRSFLRDGST
jgi:hypothetical protein